jgi:glycerate dehydrogenase
MNIVFLDRNTLSPDIRLDFAPLPAVRCREHSVTLPQQVVERAQGMEIIVTNKVRIDAGIISQLPALRMIAVVATGVDHIDLDAARRHNIVVANVRNYATHSVVEHVFSGMLALRRNLLRYQSAVNRGSWCGAETFCLQTYPIDDLAGATLGIIGGGTLGLAVARLGEAFGMHVLLAERRDAVAVRAGRAAFDTVLMESDVLTLHVPLTAETHHLIGRDELARMKPHAILINTARGGVVDEAALLDVLYTGVIGGACIDVLGQEPPAADHPLLRAGLPNLLVTPHIAWASRQAQQQLADEVVLNIGAFLRSEARNRVV